MSNSPDASATPEEAGGSPCGCAVCIAHQSTSTQQLAKHNMKKKRYVAPQPDADTYASQQAFLDSLSPIAVAQVESNNLKCPICWKTYGEPPDPGFDNSELPVRLRCHHVFGQKCLASTFGMPNDTKVELHALSFSPGSRGAALGHRLHTYVSQHGGNHEEATLPRKGDRQNGIAIILAEMMQQAYQPGQGQNLFGDFWWPILRSVGSQATRTGRGITFMENAIVMDHLPTTYVDTASSLHGVLQPGALTSTNTDLNQPLSQAISAFPASAAPLSMSSYNNVPSDFLGPTNKSSALPAGTTSITGQDAENSKKAGPCSQLAMGWAAPQPGVSNQSPGTWEDALTAETNLDKLAALNKAAQHNSAAYTSSPGAIAHLDKKVFEMAHKNRLAQQEAKLRLVSTISNTMSATLTGLYAQYLQEAPRILPDPRTERQPNIILRSVLMHERDAMATEYKISSPQLQMPYLNEDDEENHPMCTIDSATMFFVITRSPCLKRSCVGAGKKRVKELPVPSALRWRNDAKTPDDCPVCHKILFLKNKADLSYTIHGSDSSDYSSTLEDLTDGLSDGDL